VALYLQRGTERHLQHVRSRSTRTTPNQRGRSRVLPRRPPHRVRPPVARERTRSGRVVALDAARADTHPEKGSGCGVDWRTRATGARAARGRPKLGSTARDRVPHTAGVPQRAAARGSRIAGSSTLSTCTSLSTPQHTQHSLYFPCTSVERLDLAYREIAKRTGARQRALDRVACLNARLSHHQSNQHRRQAGSRR
jgi:hypothetical protein